MSHVTSMKLYQPEDKNGYDKEIIQRISCLENWNVTMWPICWCCCYFLKIFLSRPKRWSVKWKQKWSIVITVNMIDGSSGHREKFFLVVVVVVIRIIFRSRILERNRGPREYKDDLYGPMLYWVPYTKTDKAMRQKLLSLLIIVIIELFDNRMPINYDMLQIE